MRNLLVLLCALVLTLAVPVLLSGQDDKPGPNKAEVVDPLADAARAVGGEWVDEAGVKDPNASHGRFISEWAPGKKLLRSRTFWHTGGKGTQIYEGAQYWHPGRKELVMFEVSSAGEVYEGVITEKEGTSIVRFTAYSAAGKAEYEQHGGYIDDDTMWSKVYQKKGEELALLKEFKFHRKPVGWPNHEKTE